MNIWNINSLLLFLIFFIPGFISITIYDLLVPTKRRDYSKAWFEAVAYSSIHYAALSWLIIIIQSPNFIANHKVIYIILVLLIMFILPAFWPIVFYHLHRFRPFLKFMRHPCPTSWDYIFSKKESFWIIVHLKDGRKIGGIYDTESFASSYPNEEQIYLEEAWEINNEGIFIKPIKRSKGILIFGKDILALEFFKQQEVQNA